MPSSITKFGLKIGHCLQKLKSYSGIFLRHGDVYVSLVPCRSVPSPYCCVFWVHWPKVSSSFLS